MEIKKFPHTLRVDASMPYTRQKAGENEWKNNIYDEAHVYSMHSKICAWCVYCLQQEFIWVYTVYARLCECSFEAVYFNYYPFYFPSLLSSTPLSFCVLLPLLFTSVASLLFLFAQKSNILGWFCCFPRFSRIFPTRNEFNMWNVWILKSNVMCEIWHTSLTLCMCVI